MVGSLRLTGSHVLRVEYEGSLGIVNSNFRPVPRIPEQPFRVELDRSADQHRFCEPDCETRHEGGLPEEVLYSRLVVHVVVHPATALWTLQLIRVISRPSCFGSGSCRAAPIPRMRIAS